MVTEESGFLDLVSFGDVALSVEPVAHESLGHPGSNEPSKTEPAALTQHVAFENTIARKKVMKRNRKICSRVLPYSKTAPFCQKITGVLREPLGKRPSKNIVSFIGLFRKRDL